jgi:hypothetical protein
MTTNPDDGGGAPSPQETNELRGKGIPPPLPVDETTGLPGLRTWRAVYTVVIGLFVLWVGLLAWLTVSYS